jgi:hypothetical protein
MMTECVELRLNAGRKLLLGVAGLMAVAMPVTFGLVAAAQSHAQSQHENAASNQDAGGKAPAFDFVTVKPGTYMSGMGMRAGTTPNSFSATNISLENLISNAYGLQMKDLIFRVAGMGQIGQIRY